MKEKSVRL